MVGQAVVNWPTESFPISISHSGTSAQIAKRQLHGVICVAWPIYIYSRSRDKQNSPFLCAIRFDVNHSDSCVKRLTLGLHPLIHCAEHQIQCQSMIFL